MSGPLATFSPAAIDFGVRVVATQESRTVAITNAGDEGFELPMRPGFAFAPTTVGAGQTVQVAVTFSPLHAGAYDTTVFQPADDAGAAPTTAGGVLTLSGRGAIVKWTPATIALGNVPVGDVAHGYIDVTYDAGGAAAATVTGYTGPFTGTGSATSSATSTTRIDVELRPTAAGAVSTTLTLTAPATVLGATPPTCLVSGTGVTDQALVTAARAAAERRASELDKQAEDELAAVRASQSGTDRSVKYWELELDHTAEGKTFNSYLRIGSAEPNPVLADSQGARNDVADLEDRRGHDLAAMVVDFRDDTRLRDGYPPALPDRFDTVVKRVSESSKLHTRGGWRDHSDGNRITTTRGDKIEVIQGNYQMVVLGRHDNRGDGARQETSGGHVVGDTETETPGAVMEVRFEPAKYGGTWKIIQETLKGDTINRYHGDAENYFYGNRQVNVVGSSDEANITEGAVPGDAQGSAISKWVSGGASTQKKAKPTVENYTWAKSINAETYSDETKEKVDVNGQKWSHTIVKGFAWNTTSVAGVLLEMTNAIVHVTENASPIKVDIAFGFKLSLALAYEFKISKDGSDELVRNDGKICLKSTVTEAEKTALTAKETQLALDRTDIAQKVTQLQGNVTRLLNQETRVCAKVNELVTEVNWITANANFV